MIRVVFAEFGGKNIVDVEHFRRYLPDAKFKIYSEDSEIKNSFDEHGPIHSREADAMDRLCPRWGNRMNDFYKVKGLIESEHQIAIAFDADMRIVSQDIKAIIPLAMKFGLCLPANPRYLVRVDTERGADSDKEIDETLGAGYAFNMGIIAVNTQNTSAMAALQEYLAIMYSKPVRGPLAMWRAVYKVGFMPCILPPQWCVCARDVGIGNEIILHIGHQEVEKFYAGRY